ncbi:hypothetical protein ERX27_07450 [Macrococcus brunensis]|uniref:Phage protein n=1 Tax=Macrococcus brunensis TaxID=198483 RepID=A0A4R6BD17_9STAP|nr:hypothetical protein [Macrococcus brunensis]TDL96682.1 hypothetical protein ERX27_07450 [Macrococcus brunensis]
MSKKLKRNIIWLVKDPGNTENPELIPYMSSGFIPARLIYDAVSILKELDNPQSELSEQEQIDYLMDLVIKIYGNQFNREDILDRLHAPEFVPSLKEQVQFAAQGYQSDETKKYLESIS